MPIKETAMHLTVAEFMSKTLGDLRKSGVVTDVNFALTLVHGSRRVGSQDDSVVLVEGAQVSFTTVPRERHANSRMED